RVGYPAHAALPPSTLFRVGRWLGRKTAGPSCWSVSPPSSSFAIVYSLNTLIAANRSLLAASSSYRMLSKTSSIDFFLSFAQRRAVLSIRATWRALNVSGFLPAPSRAPPHPDLAFPDIVYTPYLIRQSVLIVERDDG